MKVDIVPKPIPANASPVPKGATDLRTEKNEFRTSFDIAYSAFLLMVVIRPISPTKVVKSAIDQLPRCSDIKTPSGAPMAIEL
ncbi:hypothetical protein D3C78_1439280 [compost metagenome]